MDQLTAKKIASLINRRNNLPTKLESYDIINNNYFYIGLQDQGKIDTVVACGRVKTQSFFSAELKHISVNEEYEGHGFGKYMIEMCEEYVREKGLPLVTATTRLENFSIIHIFKKLNYNASKEFIHPKTKNKLILWTKIFD